MTMLFVYMFALSFGLCLIVSAGARATAKRLGLVDRPDGRRKIHGRVIPVAGGIAIFLSTSLAFGILWLTSSELRSTLSAHVRQLVTLWAASALIVAVGVLDDWRGLRGRQKFLGQLLAVAIVLSVVPIIRKITILDFDIELGLLALPFTVFLLLGAINSLNLLDGMDGFLGSISLIVCIGMAIMALLGGHWAPACLAVVLAGAILGFLPYNFPPATMFLGDGGSMLIGLAVGVLAIQSSLKGPATIALAAPLATLTLPILDTSAAIIRRKLTGRGLCSTDRGHIHHCLFRRSNSNQRVLVWVASLCLVTVIGALASIAFRNELLAVFSTLLVVGVLLTTELFGNAEFLLIKKRLAALVVSFLKDSGRQAAQQMEMRLQGSANWQQLWYTLTGCAEQLNLKSLYLDVNAPAIHEGYHARWDRPGLSVEEHALWRVELPLAGRGHVLGRLKIIGQQDEYPVSQKVAEVVKLVETEIADLLENMDVGLAMPHASTQPAQTESPHTPSTPLAAFDHQPFAVPTRPS